MKFQAFDTMSAAIELQASDVEYGQAVAMAIQRLDFAGPGLEQSLGMVVLYKALPVSSLRLIVWTVSLATSIPGART